MCARSRIIQPVSSIRPEPSRGDNTLPSASMKRSESGSQVSVLSTMMITVGEGGLISPPSSATA